MTDKRFERGLNKVRVEQLRLKKLQELSKGAAAISMSSIDN